MNKQYTLAMLAFGFCFLSGCERFEGDPDAIAQEWVRSPLVHDSIIEEKGLSAAELASFHQAQEAALQKMREYVAKRIEKDLTPEERILLEEFSQSSAHDKFREIFMSEEYLTLHNELYLPVMEIVFDQE